MLNEECTMAIVGLITVLGVIAWLWGRCTLEI